MRQNRYVLFSIDTHFEVFHPLVGAILCPRQVKSYLAFAHLDVFPLWVEAILCVRSGKFYLVLTHFPCV